MRFSSRMTALLLSVLMLLSLVPMTAYAEELTEGNYTYAVNEDGNSVTITGYTGEDAALTVPSELGGYKVTVIGTNAFSSNYDITSVSIPSSVVTVDAMAFYNCANLASVELTPYTLYVGYQAFHGTAYFNNMPDGPVYIGRVLYGYAGIMPSKTSITVSYGTSSISPYAFYKQVNLTEIYLPVGMRAIESFAFMGCTNLLTMRVPPSVTAVGDAAFLNAGGNVTIYGVNGSAMDEYAEAEGLFFSHDETLDFPDGDVNRDKAVDSRDLRILMRMLLIDGLAVDEERVASCDLVYDGTVDSADIRALLRHSLGL